MASNLRKRRGVLRASITRLGGRLTELESTVDQPRTADHADHARQLINKLQSDFKKLHFEIIDLIDEDDADSMETEQGTNLMTMSHHTTRSIDDPYFTGCCTCYTP